MLPQQQCCCPHVGRPSTHMGPIVHWHTPRDWFQPHHHMHAARNTALRASSATHAATVPGAVRYNPAQVLADDDQAADVTPQGPKYVTYQEYVAQRQQLQEQQQQHQTAGQRADETAHASTSAPNQDGPAKRVPWNKGRKHSAMTIARIREGATRAAQRPEVRAKLDAWNQSRIGSKMSDEVKAKIAERQREAMERKVQSMTPEEAEAYRAKRSAVAKRLWQDPEYATRTVSAIQAAGRRRRSDTHRAAGGEAAGDDGSSSSSSGGRRSSRQRSAAVVQSSSSGAEGGQQQRVPKIKAPTQKELAAWAKEQQQQQQQQLQQQVVLMLQTRRLIATTEQTVAQLRSNMAAFENNPQVQATAAAALQQAQSHLEPAKQLVSKLQASLDKHGVHWDPSGGQITHVNHQPLAQQAAASKARGSRSAAAGSRTHQGRASSSSSSSTGRLSGDIGPDVVRSSRSKASAVQSSSQADDGLVVSSRRRGMAAEAAAAGGGSKGSPTPGASWTPVGAAAAAEGGGAAYSNGHSSLHNGNGNGRNGHGSSAGSMYVPLRVSDHDAESVGTVDGEDE